PVSNPILNKAAIAADLKFAVLIILLFKWLLFYFILQRYGYKISGTLLSGSKGVTQKLNYLFS
ncbi:hypothetical protein, partial [Bacteroides ovatus]|uniref:hypothetical protein n=1 Tax=Bacteroides ovatus TaxID=28116 RepID=UPI00321C31D1